jgi:hypothetical protein
VLAIAGAIVLAMTAAGGAAAKKPSPVPAAPGIWISTQELKRLPTNGSAWRALLATAEGPFGGADVSNQNSPHDVRTLAAALAAVRTGRADLRARATTALVSAIGTEADARWLAVGRNMGGYALAADILDLRADSDPASAGSRIQAWLAGFLTRPLRHNNSDVQITLKRSAWSSGSNASAQEGFVHAAIAAYLRDKKELAWAWNGFRRYAGDRSSPHKLIANDLSWQADPSDPVGIQDAGATKDGCRLDGAIANDMARGSHFRCSPRYTQYPWVGLEGVVPAAVLLGRAGYPSWTVANRAIFRAYDYLWYLRLQTGRDKWFDGKRSRETIVLVNRAYGSTFPVSLPAGEGRTVGFTDWTHALGAAAISRPGPRPVSTESASP